MMRKLLLAAALIGCIVGVSTAPLLASQPEGEDAGKAPLSAAAAAIGAGLAIGLAGIGTGLAQSRIGPAAIGAVAENPKVTGTVFLFLVIPETIVILGFVVAFLLFAG